MTTNYENALKEMRQEAERITLQSPEEIDKIFRFGIVESRAGSYDQYFTTLVFIQGEVRVIHYFYVTYLIKLLEAEEFNLDQIKTLIRRLRISIEFLGYTGFKNLEKYYVYIEQLLESIDSKKQLWELLDAFNFYLCNIHSWIDHYFPWNMGSAYRQRPPEEFKAMGQVMTGLDA